VDVLTSSGDAVVAPSKSRAVFWLLLSREAIAFLIKPKF
jgi:hypothetical protein